MLFDYKSMTDDLKECYPRIIVDTDMMTDCDDCLALGLLHRLADRDEADILGVMVSSKHPESALAVDRINTYYQRSDLPLGRPISGSGFYSDKSCFIGKLSTEFPGRFGIADEIPDAVSLCRGILAQQPDRSVSFVTIGYMSNLSDLLKSEPDDISDLSGMELVHRKITEWVCMGGNFPVDDAEHNVNFSRDPQAALHAISRWPAKTVFVGREIGHRIFTGNFLKQFDDANPVKRAYQLHRSRLGPDANWDHHTADPCTILYAVRGAGNYWTLCENGGVELREDLSFEWKEEINSNQAHLKQVMSRSRVAKIIESAFK